MFNARSPAFASNDKRSPKVKQNWNKIRNMPTAHAQNKIETELEENLSATECARTIFIIFRYALTLSKGKSCLITSYIIKS